MRKVGRCLVFLIVATIAVLSSRSHAVAGDTGVFPPKIIKPIPDIATQPGQSKTINWNAYIACSTAQGSAVGHPVWSSNGLSTPSCGPDQNGITACVAGSSSTNAQVSCCNDAGCVADTFNWLVGSAPPPVALAQGARNFFVCPLTPPSGYAAGNDSRSEAQAQNYATPWATLSKVNGFAFTNGDDIWFCGGGEWKNETLTVKVNGVDEFNNRSIVGSYYVSGGTAYVNSPTNFTISTRPRTYIRTQPLPIFRGTYGASCRHPGTNAPFCFVNILSNPTVLWPGTSVPNEIYSAMIKVQGQYVTLQDIDVEDSAGTGVVTACSSGSSSGVCDSRMIIQRMKVHGTALNSMTIHYVDHIVVRFNDVSSDQLAALDQVPDYNTYIRGETINAITCNPCYALFEGNDSHNSVGGQTAYAASYVLVRGGEIMDSSGFYNKGGGTNYVWEQNILYGGTNSIADDPNGNQDNAYQKRAPGFWNFGQENPTNATLFPAGGPIVNRNNIVTQAHGHGMNLTCNPCGAQHVGMIGVKFLGNTFIKTVDDGSSKAINWTNLGGSFDQYMSAAGVTASNNLILNQTANQCTQTALAAHTHLDHNYWAVQPIAACQGTNDVNGGNSGIAAKSWATIDYTEGWMPTVADVTPVGGVTLDAGSAMTGTGFIDSTNWTWVLQQRMWQPLCNKTGAQVSAAEWVKDDTTDFCGNPRTHHDIGAITQ